MFKLTGTSGRRNASGGSGVARVSATRLTRVTSAPGPRTVAYQPDTQQEHAFDSSSPRLQGLEKRMAMG